LKTKRSGTALECGDAALAPLFFMALLVLRIGHPTA